MEVKRANQASVMYLGFSCGWAFVAGLTLLTSWRGAAIAAERVLPEDAKTILGNADAIVAYALEPAQPKETTKETFHGWVVLGKTALKDTATQKQFLGAIENLLTHPGSGGARCFTPRHALRATREGKSVDFVICFECGWVDLYQGDKQEAVRIEMATGDGEPTRLERLLEDALPKAKDQPTGRLVLEKENKRSTNGVLECGVVDCVDCSADGRELLVGTQFTCDAGGIEIYDARDLTLKRRLPVRSWRALFTADGKQILSARISYAIGEPPDHGIKVVNAVTGKVETKLADDPQFCIARKLNVLAYGTLDSVCLFDLTRKETTHSWKAPQGSALPTLHCITEAGVVAFQVGVQDELLWLPPYDKAPMSIPVGMYVGHDVSVSPNGRHLAVKTEKYKNSVEVWDVATKKRLPALDKHTSEWGDVRGLLFSPDGKYLASLSSYNSRNKAEVIVWETKHFQEIGRVVVHEGMAESIVFYPDSKHFATGGNDDGSLKVWRIEDEPKKAE